MCVILFCDETRPSESMVGRSFLKNDKGAGIAWREEVDGKKVVKWKKGLEMDEIQDLCKKVPLPFVAHFRIPSFGGPHKLLNHPFPVDPQAELAYEGQTEGKVLFHNGSWSEWRKFSLDTASRQPEKFPKGRWSDTRAMAWCASIYGLGVLELINEKVIVFSPENIDIFGDGWDEVDGVFVSNLAWKGQAWPPPNSKYGPAQHVKTAVERPVQRPLPTKTLSLPVVGARNEKAGGTSQNGTFRTSRSSETSCTARSDDDREQVEGSSEPVCEGSEDGNGRHIVCIKENFGGVESDYSLEVENDSVTLTREEELKKWALATQDNPAKGRPRVINMPHPDSAERARHLENARKGIVRGF